MKKENGILKLLNIRPEETGAVLLLIVFSFFTGLTLSFYFTASNAIFLKHFPSRMISLSYVASGVAVYLAWLVLSRIDRKLSIPMQLVLKFIFVFSTVLAITFWVWIYDTPAAAFVMFTWIRVLVYITLITFWGMAGKLFSIRQGKRVFGLIGIGEVVSILIGYFSIPLLLNVLKAKDLLFVSSGALLICLLITLLIIRRFRAQLTDIPAAAVPENAKQKRKETTYIRLLKQPYFRYISLMAFLPIFGYLFVDFLFLDQTKQEFADNPEMISGFLGLFLGFTSFIELIFKFISGRLLSKYGLKISLMALPAVLLFSGTLSAFFGTLYGSLGLFFALIALARLFERSIRGSIYEPSFQLLYQPIPESQRLVFQNQIEGIPKALSTIVTGEVIYLLSSVKVLNIVHFNYFYVLVLAFWIWAALQMYKEYRTTIRAKLAAMRESSSQDQIPEVPEPVEPDPVGAVPARYSFEELHAMCSAPDATTRCEAAELLAETGRYNAYRSIQMLLNDPEPAVKKAAILSAGKIKRFELWSGIIENLGNAEYGNTAAIAAISIGSSILPEIERHFSSLENKREASLRIIRIYKEIGGELSIKYLRNKIYHPDKDIRYHVLLALSELEYQATGSEHPAIKQTIDELAETMVWCMSSWFDVISGKPENPLHQALEQEIHEKKESIFLLLSLIFESKTIRYIRENIEGKDAKARMYAMEVCDMTVSADIKDLILSLFDEVSMKEKLERFLPLYPQQSLSMAERLSDIINKDYGKVNKWTKACAMRMLAESQMPQPALRQLLSAGCYNPDPLLKDTALREFLRFFPDNPRPPSLPEPALYDRVVLLRKCSLFEHMDEQILSGFAGSWNEMPAHVSGVFLLKTGGNPKLWIQDEVLKEFLLGFRRSLSDEQIRMELNLNEITYE